MPIRDRTSTENILADDKRILTHKLERSKADQDILIGANKILAKKVRKSTEHLNRIRNNIVGNQRIYYLDTIAVTLSTDAELARQDGEELVAVDLEKQALFIQRLQYDLRKQHTAINDLKPKRVGRVDYAAGKYDPDNWGGPRP